MAASGSDDLNCDKVLEQIKSLGGVMLLLGLTGSGKSSIGNALMGGHRPFLEVASLQSGTETVQLSCSSTKPSFGVVDTPGFLDTEGRSDEHRRALVRLLSEFPPDRLRLVLFPLPLTEIRAKSSYSDALEELVVLFGEQLYSHLVFVTTHANSLNPSHRSAAQVMDEWGNHLVQHLGWSEPRICPFTYGDPSSLDPIKSWFDASPSFLPEIALQTTLLRKIDPSSSKESFYDPSAVTARLEQKMKERLLKEEELRAAYFKELMVEKARLAEITFQLENKCLKGHLLVLGSPTSGGYRSGWICNTCGARHPPMGPRYNCLTCYYDQCMRCYERKKLLLSAPNPAELRKITCEKAHPLVLKDARFRGTFICNHCGIISNGMVAQRHRCDACDYDLCLPCFDVLSRNIPAVGSLKCAKGHPLVLGANFSGAYCRGWRCNKCQRTGIPSRVSIPRYYCATCAYDICRSCACLPS